MAFSFFHLKYSVAFSLLYYKIQIAMESNPVPNLLLRRFLVFEGQRSTEKKSMQ